MPEAACQSNTPRLRTVYAGRDLLQLVSKHNAVLLAATASHYDTRGWLSTEHAAVDLPISAARELAEALAAAIADAEVIDDPAQSGLWCEETLRQQAAMEPKRRRGGG